MKTTVTIGRASLILPIVLLIAACGARSLVEKKIPRELLLEGRFTEARAAALEAGLDDQTNRAIVALSHIAEAPTADSARKAVSVLADDARNVRAAATALEMLALAHEIPQPVAPEVSMLLAEAWPWPCWRGPPRPLSARGSRLTTRGCSPYGTAASPWTADPSRAAVISRHGASSRASRPWRSS
jgi:hypothetical protein